MFIEATHPEHLASSARSGMKTLWSHIGNGYFHAAPLGLAAVSDADGYKHVAPPGLGRRFGAGCYKHAAPLGLTVASDADFYKHAVPPGLGRGPRRDHKEMGQNAFSTLFVLFVVKYHSINALQ